MMKHINIFKAADEQEKGRRYKERVKGWLKELQQTGNLSYNSDLDGIPTQINGDLMCDQNKIKFTIDDVNKYTKVKGKTILR